MRGWNTHSKGGRVKIPLLPYKIGERSGTMVTTGINFVANMMIILNSIFWLRKRLFMSIKPLINELLKCQYHLPWLAWRFLNKKTIRALKCQAQNFEVCFPFQPGYKAIEKHGPMYFENFFESQICFIKNLFLVQNLLLLKSR